jgi:hypothetical protein
LRNSGDWLTFDWDSVVWYFKHQDRLQGPCTTAAMHEYLAQGVITRETLVTRDGEGAWSAIYLTPELCQRVAPQIDRSDSAAIARAGSAHDRKVYWEYLQEIGRSQRALIVAFLAAMPIRVIPIAMALLLEAPLRWIVLSVVDGVTIIVLAVFVNRLATSMRIAAWPWIVGLCIPLAWWPIMILLISRATRIMQASGMQVGLLGAKKLDCPPKSLVAV